MSARLDSGAVDHTRWVRVPPADFPDVAAYARVVAEAHAGPGGAGELAEVLAYGMERYPRVYPGYGLHFHMEGPRGIPLAVYSAEFDLEGMAGGEADADEELRALTHADADYAVEPPVVEEFGGGRLGTGIRVLRYFVDPDDGADGADGADGVDRDDGGNGITVGLRYAWRVPEHGADVLVLTAAPDPGRVLRAMDDIDAFARALRFAP
ncbi:hypothetical protein ABZ901_11075 [Actinacidiphila alni]|uniref:hypothetical protein n=1 Tax=Actinacidiphila alni TaxID=380248 RepID=UPI0033D16B9F